MSNSELHQAVKNGDFSLIKKLLDQGVPIDSTYNGITPLALAVIVLNDLETIKELIQYGANINFCDEYGTSILMAAAYLGRSEIIRILLRAGEIVCFSTEWNRSACGTHAGKSPKMNTIDSRDQNGMTSLMYAAKNRHLDSVQLLLQFGADINIQNNERKTAYDLGNDKVRLLITNFLKIKNLLLDKNTYFDVIPKDICDLIENQLKLMIIDQNSLKQ